MSAMGRLEPGSPVVEGFFNAVPTVFRAAEESEGFIARAIKPVPELPSSGQIFGEFGEYALPRFAQGDNINQTAVTLSLWTGVEVVRRFAYGGQQHKNALMKRSDWFLKPAWPTYVMWWVSDEHVPNWREASDRLEYIDDHGPTPHAFNFGTVFNADGHRAFAAAR